MGKHAGYTYEEVVDAVERCAAHIVALDNASVVALVAHRSYAMVVSLLGVLRSGKAYCPIEPDFPAARVATMLETASIKHVLVPAEQLPQPVLNGFKDLSIYAVHASGRIDLPCGGIAPHKEELVPAAVADNTMSYVLFTSGSTGKPKGCMVPHRGGALYARAVKEACNLTEDMTFILKTPYVFDISVQDMFVAFAAHGTLAIAEPGAHRDAGEMVEHIQNLGLNCVCFVPTLLVEFVNYLTAHPEEVEGVRKTLQKVFCIGEALKAVTCRQLLELVPGLKIHNLYGPTEASIGVSHYETSLDTMGDCVVVPIGTPFSYVDFKIYDPSKYEDKKIEASLLVESKPGEIGELFIGGDCLAQGYIQAPEKTEAAFFDFPQLLARPHAAASPFSLYKTGDLVKCREDGAFEYMGRNDFQVKIGGVRVECEEVSAVVMEHPAVDDCLVTAFEGPYGKALAAYIVAKPGTDWAEIAAEMHKAPEGEADDSLDNVSKWGAVYDEMYQQTDDSISTADPTLNWSGYTDTYSQVPHIEPVIKEWVEWSCEQVSRHNSVFQANAQANRQSMVTELGCGNGMLLFRLAPNLKHPKDRYIGTDISTAALDYIKNMVPRPEYKDLGIETATIAAHEILNVCDKHSNDVVLCNGVTMYFPSGNYLLECMQTAVSATKANGHVIIGDVQSKRHLLPFRAHVETFQALQRGDASTCKSVLSKIRRTAAGEELSYFDDEFFHRLDKVGSELFDNRLARVELRLKRGWWHSEFNRFRFDIELVLNDAPEGGVANAKAQKDLNLERSAYDEVCTAMSLEAPGPAELMNPAMAGALPNYIANRCSSTDVSVDGYVLQLPNARTLQSVRLLEWIEASAENGTTMADCPKHLHPVAASCGEALKDTHAGLEPEMLFTMEMPNGWQQRVIWDSDPAYLRLAVLRDAAAEQPWLSAVCNASTEKLPEDLSAFKNRAEDVPQDEEEVDPIKLCNDSMKIWSMTTPLLAATRPTVYIPLEKFPKNQADKTDRGALPDACTVLESIAANAFEPPETEDEKKMAAVWEGVLKAPVGVNTPFIAYGGHSLTAMQLRSAVATSFGRQPDLVFLTSEECTVRSLLHKLHHEGPTDQESMSCIVRLSPPERTTGAPLIIFTAAGASAATYQLVAEQAAAMQVFAVELPGRGQRASEPNEEDFKTLFDQLEPEVMSWVKHHKEFFCWGDSLGAVIAYEFARIWEKTPGVDFRGLFVSGNAGPMVASAECGMGGSATTHLGIERTSALDMTTEDWGQFLLASTAESGREGLEKILKDRELAEAVLAPLRADCIVYETYKLAKAEKISTPIIALRGELDNITSKAAISSWKDVAGGRLENKEFHKAGHMLAREVPRDLAQMMGQVVWDIGMSDKSKRPTNSPPRGD